MNRALFVIGFLFAMGCTPQEIIKTIYVEADSGDNNRFTPTTDAGVLPLDSGKAAFDAEVTLPDSAAVKPLPDAAIPDSAVTPPIPDSAVKPDTAITPVPDAAVGPPPECMHDTDCDDKLPCTTNLCLLGKCNYATPAPNTCHIWGKCQKAGEKQSTGDLICDPKDPLNWSVEDATWGLWAGDGRKVYKDGIGDQASFDGVEDMVVGLDGTLYVSTKLGTVGVIRSIKNGKVSLYAGGGTVGLEGQRLKVGFATPPGHMLVTDDGSLYFTLKADWWRIYKDQVTFVPTLFVPETYFHRTNINIKFPVLPNNTIVYQDTIPGTGGSVFKTWKNGMVQTLSYVRPQEVGVLANFYAKPPFDTCNADRIVIAGTYNFHALYPDGTALCLSGECGSQISWNSVDGTGTTSRYSMINSIEHYSKFHRGGTILVNDNGDLRLVGYCTGGAKTVWGKNSAYPGTFIPCAPDGSCEAYARKMAADKVSGKIYFSTSENQIFVTKPLTKDIVSMYLY